MPLYFEQEVFVDTMEVMLKIRPAGADITFGLYTEVRRDTETQGQYIHQPIQEHSITGCA